MRILRYTSPALDDRNVWLSAVSLAGDRLVAVRQGRALRLYDLHGPDEPLVDIADAAQYALQPDALVVSGSSGRLQRYEPHHDSWSSVADIPCPQAPGASSPRPNRLILSPSTRYLLVESAPIPREPPYWPLAHAHLLDAETGEVKYDVALRKEYVRANFGLLPTGAEVLFVSAESYMSVQMVDCESGRLLHEYRADEESFCHTDYALSADGRRLIAFGCWWACPYEARIYDATPWTVNAAPAPGFPLPPIYQLEERFYCDNVLPMRGAPDNRWHRHLYRPHESGRGRCPGLSRGS